MFFVKGAFDICKCKHVRGYLDEVFPSAIWRLSSFYASLILLCAFGFVQFCYSQAAPARIDYDSSTRVFRIEAADMSYEFAVNDKEQLQALYWGKRIPSLDRFPIAHSLNGTSSFDPSTDATPQEYVGWGGGFYAVPDLKITFPDGNRDLVLHFVSHTIDNNALTILLKDIQRSVLVSVRYEIDPETGILARSTRIENKTEAPLSVEGASSATWNLPGDHDY